ncbi:hypothetical protein E2C01_084976 [Portunus trituberculatus]|uniref:Uncharacterized protein n=1 Tax=Portunus trituberculatus TaxID=210409 RepID=A0A5B7IZQ9_PORTR|nr:hypothetical protein [Portunus trituberculatus]
MSTVSLSQLTSDLITKKRR